MNQTPEISVIMSVYNGQDYLREAIDSILAQGFQDWELIVIDDCSTDGTGEIMSQYAARYERIRVYTNEVNLRLPSSLNKAMSYARGRYIARMDADDICLPDRLEKQFVFMEGNPDVALSSCRFMTLKNGVVASGGCGGRCDHNSVKALLLVTNPILHPGIIAKADVIKRLGYDKNFTCTEDLELWTRFIMEGYQVQVQPEYLMIYRLHDKQITATTLDRQHNEVLAIQKKFYAKFLEPMTEELENIYIHGIYFREDINVDQFCEFCRWIRSRNGKTGNFDRESLSYALLEILAEYKRTGISKVNLIRAMLSFDPVFLMKEVPGRKKRARADGQKYIAAARAFGLEQSGGTDEFPVFSKRYDIGV